MHADLNAARNIRARRTSSIGSVFISKAAVLAGLMEEFGERCYWGSSGASIDPRLSNKYYVG